MHTYLVVFDLGIYKMEYESEEGFVVKRNDHHSMYSFEKVNAVFNYISPHNDDRTIPLKMHNDVVIAHYLQEYCTYLNDLVQQSKGHVAPLMHNAFAIQFDGDAEALKNKIVDESDYRFISVFITPLHTYNSNLKRERLLPLDYLQHDAR